jgi:predicted metal-dependent hydrolase
MRQPIEIHQIIRSKRRTFSLEVRPDGRLVVRAPASATDAQVQALVARKADWIRKTRTRLAAQYPTQKPKTFTPGETFWYLGELYPLHLTDRKRPPLDLDGAFLLSHAAQSRAREVFIAWYREETRQITQDLVDKYSNQYSFKVNGIRITSARTRWGSCSGKRSLNFTYRLCMAPLPVVEYVVVHELVHLRVHNHSKAFWKAVSEIDPAYKQHRAWLKENGSRLTLD